MRPRRQRGYTLVEVVIAFALLAAALTLLLGTLSGAARQVRDAGDAGRAALHAQSLLDTLGVSMPLRPGRHEGDFELGRYRWALVIAPWNDPATAGLANRKISLYEVALDIRWGDGERQHLEVRSLRTAGVQDGSPR